MAYGRGSTPGATSNGILGMGFDSDTGQVNMYWNGADQGAMTVGLRTDNGHYAFGCGANSQLATFNFGQQPFQSPIPYGYKALCSSNLYDVGITTVRNSDINPENHIGIVTYTGTGSTRSITDLKFQPDFVWLKKRNGATYYNMFDTVRGATKFVCSNVTDEEDTSASRLNRFDPNGFQLGSSGVVNASGDTYVAWCWKAGGNKNTFNVDDVGYATFAASGTPSGATTPTGTSINTKAGFSIIRFTPTSAGGTATVPHGLGKPPGLILMKSLTNTYNWDVYQIFATPGGSNRLILNSNNNVDSSDPFSNVSPTKDVFTFNNAFYADASDDVICYCWADTPGISKFGMYEGNGNANGPFVYLGFRPSIIWYKQLGSGYWNIRDDKRTRFNDTAEELYTATSEAENTHNSREIDFLSDGFKIRFSHSAINGDGQDYIYMCWSAQAISNQYGGIPNAF